MNSPSNHPDLPLHLGDYRVSALLAADRDTAVYLAALPSSPQRFALKAARQPAAMARLRQEAATTAALDHPHIVAVHGYQQDQEHGYIVMDYIDGGSLSAQLQAGPVPPLQAVDWTCQLLAALEHVHQRGVIHGDIKPSNLLLDGAGRLLLTDFGLATRAGQAVSAMPVGSPAYMAPALLRGAAPDVRSDLHAAALVLYRMLTGVAPYQGSPFHIVQQILGPGPLLPSQAAPALGDIFDNIMTTILAASPVCSYLNESYFSAKLREVYAAMLQNKP